MPKQCIVEDCNYNVFGKGYCIRHQYLRTDKTTKQPRRTAIKKKVPKSLGERKALREKDKLFFLEIWNEREHIDFETKEPIYGELLDLYCHHVLPKSLLRYKKYRYRKWNIVILSWQTHTQAEVYEAHMPRVQAYKKWLLENLEQIENGTIIPDQNLF